MQTPETGKSASQCTVCDAVWSLPCFYGVLLYMVAIQNASISPHHVWSSDVSKSLSWLRRTFWYDCNATIASCWGPECLFEATFWLLPFWLLKEVLNSCNFSSCLWQSPRSFSEPEKEDAGARKGRKVASHCVFPMICGSGPMDLMGKQTKQSVRTTRKQFDSLNRFSRLGFQSDTLAEPTAVSNLPCLQRWYPFLGLL